MPLTEESRTYLALLGQAVNPELVTPLWANDGQRQRLRQLCRAAGVVDMGMGEPDLLKRQAAPPHFGLQYIKVATRVNDGGFQRLIAPDQGAVLLEGRDRNGVVLKHAPIVPDKQT
jgi:hypothetical protein